MLLVSSYLHLWKSHSRMRICDSQEVLRLFVQWQSKVNLIFETAKTIVPVNMRREALEDPWPIRALADYKTKEVLWTYTSHYINCHDIIYSTDHESSQYFCIIVWQLDLFHTSPTTCGTPPNINWSDCFYFFSFIVYINLIVLIVPILFYIDFKINNFA